MPAMLGISAIFAIVALGAGFLAGLMVTTPDIRHTMSELYRETNLFDLRIAGNLGLGNEITTAMVLEAPDIENWGQQGQMIITSFYALQNLSEHALADFFEKLVRIGISAVVFASSLGIGVAFSSVAILVYQGLISLSASFIAPYLGGDAVIAEMTCVGSLLIAALSLNMLGITKIKVMNLVPACLMPILLCRFM